MVFFNTTTLVVVLKNTKHLAIFTITEVKIPHERRLSVVFDNVVIPYGKNEGIVKSFTSWGLRSNPQRVEDFRSLQFFPYGNAIPFTLHHAQCKFL